MRFPVVFCLSLAASVLQAGQAFCLGNDSVIDTIQKSYASIVIINSENYAAFQSPGEAARDPSGNLIIVKPLRIARQSRQGAGVIIDRSGIIVTNAHTVSQAGKVRVTVRGLPGEFEAATLKVFPDDDVAFLKISAPIPLKSMQLAVREDIQMGSVVYNVGTSEVLRGTITEARIVGIGAKAGEEKAMIRVSLAVYYGDSGGPLFDGSGKLLGLIVAGSVSGQRIGVAVASTVIKKYLTGLAVQP